MERKNKDLVSIIVPVYKVEKYLNRCVDSVLNQTYTNLEVILVDDGSPDGCHAICDEYAKKDKRVKVIHKANGGLSDARNAGLDVATGEYLYFLDSDDYIYPTTISELYNLISEYSADFVRCDYQKVFGTDADFKKLDNEYVSTVYEGDEVINQIYNSTIPIFVTAWGKLYKKEIFDEIRFPVGKIHEDEYIFVDVMLKTKKFVFYNKPLYCYYLNSESITQKYAIKNINDSLEAFNRRKDILNNYLPKNEYLNNIHYLKCLRGIIIASENIKEENKRVKLIYKDYYKQCKKVDLKNWCFYHFMNMYISLYKIKKRNG